LADHRATRKVLKSLVFLKRKRGGVRGADATAKETDTDPLIVGHLAETTIRPPTALTA